ncbi:MAG TPA: DUF1566 domain-containing protein [Bacteroidales bacterium]|jgi:hypothetical protein|nr:DUF1566 domain-containing protein [Bacteroidales bacterium]
MWWIIGKIISGIIGVAAEILKRLQQEVSVERQRWEDSYSQLCEEIINQQQIIERKLGENKDQLTYKELSNLHSASIKSADTVYSMLKDARKTLDCMGQAIVDTAIERKALEQKKRGAFFKGGLEQQIVSLHKLRDEILIPDKDKVKAQRDKLSKEVTKLNQQTAILRDLKNKLRKEGAPLREDKKQKPKTGTPHSIAEKKPIVCTQNLFWLINTTIIKKSFNWKGANEFINALNRNKYLGYSTWRLPQRNELTNIIGTALSDYKNFMQYGDIDGEGIPKSFLKQHIDGLYWSANEKSNYGQFLIHMWSGHAEYVSENSDIVAFIWPVCSDDGYASRYRYTHMYSKFE